MATDGLENRYAIVGMGGVFPDAPDLDAFWRNIREKRVSIRRFPADSALSRVFFRPEVLRRPCKDDKTYTDLSGAIDAVAFDPEQFRIPPAVAKHMDPNQKIALLAAPVPAKAVGVLDAGTPHLAATQIPFQGIDRRRRDPFDIRLDPGVALHMEGRLNDAARLLEEAIEEGRRDPGYVDIRNGSRRFRRPRARQSAPPTPPWLGWRCGYRCGRRVPG